MSRNKTKIGVLQTQGRDALFLLCSFPVGSVLFHFRREAGPA